MTTHNRRQRHTASLQDEITRLRDQIKKYQRSAVFGCYTRQALDLDILPTFDPAGFDLLYFDIDGLTRLNATYGKAERKIADVPSVNERIAASLAAMRRDDIIVGQWFSGDEFIALVPAADLVGFAKRLADVLRSNGITATMTLASIPADLGLTLAIDAADTLTAGAKSLGLRDRIHDMRHKVI